MKIINPRIIFIFCNDKKQLGSGLWYSGLFCINRVFGSLKERIFKVSQVTEVVCHAVLSSLQN
jgi:hypothetical protein